MKTRIFIATSEGPSEIQSLVLEDPDVACAVCLNGTTEALPITRGYHAFVRKPTGVIERMTGHKSYRLDVSQAITNGESWQLGVYLAHALLEKDELALQGEAADQIWLVTGAVNARDETVQSVGHVQQKLDHANSLLQEIKAGGGEVTFIIPEADKAQIREAYAITIVPVSHADQVLVKSQQVMESRVTAKKAVLWMVAVGFIASSVIWGFRGGLYEVFFGSTEQTLVVQDISGEAEVAVEVEAAAPSAPAQDISESATSEATETIALTPSIPVAVETTAPPVAIEEMVSIEVYRLQTRDIGSCAGVKFRDTEVVQAEITNAWIHPTQDAASLCGFRFVVKNVSDRLMNLELSIMASPTEVLNGEARKMALMPIKLGAAESKAVDLPLSLFREGPFHVKVSLTSRNHSMEKVLSVLGWNAEEVKKKKYQ